MRPLHEKRGTITRRAFVCALAASGVAGCSANKPAPRAIRRGREACQNCGMTISDARWAAEIWDKEFGRVRVYDDFGCAALAAYDRGEIDASDAAFWVADESDPSRWLDARTAHYRSGAQTPMGYGYAAGSSNDHAIDFATAVAAIRDKARCAHKS